MKTKQFKLALSMLLIVAINSSIFSQSNFTFEIPSYKQASVFDNIKKDVTSNINVFNSTEVAIENEINSVEFAAQDPETVAFIATMLAVGAGIGFGESQTLWCLHAAYYLRLVAFANSALYGSLGGVYEGSKYNDYKRNYFDIQLKVLMFTAISQLKEVRLIYGLMFAYGFGSQNYDYGSGYNNKDQITAFTAALVLGFQMMIATNWSLGLQTNLFTYQKQTIKPDSGGEFKDDSTFAFINKNNILALSLYFHLGNR